MINKTIFVGILLLLVIMISPVLAESRVISFSGYDWIVKEGLNKSPGPNNWASGTDSVYVDNQGQLHLKIINKNGVWYCSSLHLKSSLGYGVYEFSTVTNNLDKNAVIGLFVYESDSKEIDIEVSRWGNENIHNLHYTVQPSNSDELHMNLQNGNAVQTFVWSSEAIKFKSEQNNNVLGEWNYQGINNFIPGRETVHINFWLSKGTPPAENQELIIKSFRFYSLEEPKVESNPEVISTPKEITVPEVVLTPTEIIAPTITTPIIEPIVSEPVVEKPILSEKPTERKHSVRACLDKIKNYFKFSSKLKKEVK